MTLPVWKELDRIVKDYLDGVKLEQFVRNTPETEGLIPADRDWNCGL